MIDPTAEDIGRKVVYTKGPSIEVGTIKSFSDAWVFVRYHEGDTAAATSRKDLDWFEETRNLTWLDVESYCYELANIVRSRKWEFDSIYAITRGGLFPALMLSHLLHIKLVDTICISSYQETEKHAISAIKLAEPGKDALIVDDISDTGDTLAYLRRSCNCKMMTIIAKPAGAHLASAYARLVPQETWVNFPWE